MCGSNMIHFLGLVFALHHHDSTSGYFSLKFNLFVCVQSNPVAFKIFQGCILI